ncbi:MAG: hypothetical protein EXR01_02765 [Acetobacteraceae bacterium]|nr:hypothetical protein [Acetobacteraceae bacterium]
MLALQYQYEETERWPANAIEARQFRQIEQLLTFAASGIAAIGLVAPQCQSPRPFIILPCCCCALI